MHSGSGSTINKIRLWNVGLEMATRMGIRLLGLLLAISLLGLAIGCDFQQMVDGEGETNKGGKSSFHGRRFGLQEV